MSQRLLQSLALVVVLAWSSSALAQSGQRVVAPTDAQLELNAQGIEAIVEADFARAIRLFRASLDLGELNITYVNLGRSHQRAGDCKSAEQGFVRALEAPAIADPSPEAIAAVIARYRAELQASCPGELVITCAPAEMTVYIGDAQGVPCPQRASAHSQGSIVVRGELDEVQTSQRVEIAPMQTSRVHLVIEGSGAGSIVAIEPVLPAARGRGLAIVYLVAGAAIVVGGGIVDTVPESASNYRFDALDVVPVGMYTVGTGLIGWGVWELVK
ncbi:MAG: hypothetical protein H0U74_12485 [Bradymonadaceae bacterium]|nr:hypothetical protein [Lujinxingiaceae bacterium]